MDTLKAKREERQEKEDIFLSLVDKAKKEALSDAETKQLDTIEAEISALDTEIEKLEKIEATAKKVVARQSEGQRVFAPPAVDGEFKEMAKLASQFSISRAMSKTKSGKLLDGAEAEVKKIAEREASDFGLSLEGQISIPSSFIKIGDVKKSAPLTVGTEGADIVFTEYGGKVIPYLNPNPVAAQMGVTFLQNLNGDVQWPRVSGDLSFAFETETSDVDETTPTFNNVKVSPNRFGGYVDVTMQVQKQAPFMVDSMIRNMLNLRYEITLDQIIFNGSGSGNQPYGLFNYAGVNVASTGSGSTSNNMTYPLLMSMKRDAKAANARSGRAGWVTNSYGEFALFQTPLQASGIEGNFILNPNYGGRLAGDPFMVSEIIPSNFSEGSNSDLCGIAYSTNWAGLICALWGGIDLTYDPITQKLGGKDRFIVNGFMDVDIEQPLEFSICKDWDATDLPALT